VTAEQETRTRRIVENEALFRSINEELEPLNRGIASIADQTFHIVCECGNLTCRERIVVPTSAYEAVRADAALFFVRPGHELPSAEQVVRETGAFNIVRKHPGEPQAIAEATNPRS
jgi:hypothetical protein